MSWARRLNRCVMSRGCRGDEKTGLEFVAVVVVCGVIAVLALVASVAVVFFGVVFDEWLRDQVMLIWESVRNG